MTEHQHLKSISMPLQTSPFPPIPSYQEEEETDSNGKIYNAQLVCQWNHCLRVFPNHSALAGHLSEDHIGWKKGGYSCDWDNCSRQGAKCHNRFALMMHLRIHTGEKPFECKTPNCGQTFGRMDALTRHQKAEHGEGIIEKPIKPAHTTNIIPLLNPPTAASAAAITTTTTNATTAASLTSAKPKKNNHNNNINSNNKRPAPPSLDMLSKYKRTTMLDDWETSNAIVENKLPEQSTSTKKEPTRGTAYSQYRLAKAQLHYILRENEMLRDEYETTQKKLKRMKTERRVLLDALMTKEQFNGMEQEREEEEEEEEKDIQDDHLSNIEVA